MNSENNRRKFFKDLKIETSNTVLGFIKTVLPDFKIEDTKSKTRKKCISSGEPLNNTGTPFGGRVSSVALVRKSKNIVYIIVAHREDLPPSFQDSKECGVSVLHLQKYDELNYNCNYGSSHTRRISGKDLIIEATNEKQWIDSNGPHKIRHLVSTPWMTVLALEEGGAILEINPESGFVSRRYIFGKNPDLSFLQLQCEPGQPIKLNAFSNKNEKYIYTTLELFDRRAINLNKEIFNDGSMEKSTTVEIPIQSELKIQDEDLVVYVKEEPIGSSLWIEY